MRRRQFIAALGGAAMWPLQLRAEQSAKPIIGYLSGRSPDNSADIVAAFRQGLKEAGFVDGANAAIEFRFAEGNFGQLPDLAADLIRIQARVHSEIANAEQ